jgi:hypothetical protein
MWSLDFSISQKNVATTSSALPKLNSILCTYWFRSFFFLKSITFTFEKVRAPNICENKAPVVRSYWTFWFFPIHHHEFSSAWEVHYIFLGNKEEKVEKLLRKKYRNFGMKNCSRNFIGGGTKLVVFCRSSNNSGILDLVPPSFSPTEKYFGILLFLGKKDWLGIYY